MRENLTLKTGNGGFTVRYQVPTVGTMKIIVLESDVMQCGECLPK
jgi:hypothetical protein